MSQSKIVFKDTFAVMGKAGQGPRETAPQWIAPLWQSANTHFTEIQGLILKREDGAPLGMWGAMNNNAETNLPWDEEGGKYMAGCEAPLACAVPEGWTRWVIPAQTYLVFPCTTADYHAVFSAARAEVADRLAGTVHEHYPDLGSTDAIELYFPIAKGALENG